MSEVDRAETTARSQAQQAQMETLLGYVLLGGVIVSVVLLVAGLVWRWIDTGHLSMDYTIPQLNLFEFVTVEIRELISGRLRPRLLVSLGIVALMLTPYLRVLASLLFFGFVEHNWKYSAFTGFVLAVLTYSLFLR